MKGELEPIANANKQLKRDLGRVMGALAEQKERDRSDVTGPDETGALDYKNELLELKQMVGRLSAVIGGLVVFLVCAAFVALGFGLRKTAALAGDRVWA